MFLCPATQALDISIHHRKEKKKEEDVCVCVSCHTFSNSLQHHLCFLPLYMHIYVFHCYCLFFIIYLHQFSSFIYPPPIFSAHTLFVRKPPETRKSLNQPGAHIISRQNSFPLFRHAPPFLPRIFMKPVLRYRTCHNHSRISDLFF